jgi:hypothetical protein
MRNAEPPLTGNPASKAQFDYALKFRSGVPVLIRIQAWSPTLCLSLRALSPEIASSIHRVKSSRRNFDLDGQILVARTDQEVKRKSVRMSK